MGHVRNILLAGIVMLLLQTAVPHSATAGGGCAGLILTCENGRFYPLCPIAVTVEGEIVTGRLGVGPRRSVHVRLVPMGVGYRYIGRGIWFDGVRGDAVLYFGKSRPVACTVSRG